MKGASQYQEAIRDAVFASLGRSKRALGIFGAQLYFGAEPGLFAHLPTIEAPSPIDTNPASPTFGKWVLGVDLIGVDSGRVA